MNFRVPGTSEVQLSPGKGAQEERGVPVKTTAPTDLAASLREWGEGHSA